MFSSFDEQMMQRAMTLAMKARVIAPPNPWVGCVIVKDKQIIGEGFTLPAGEAHAEVNALLQAKSLAKGATAYVTLEPCSHYGRTPPCTKTLIEAGIKEVVIGIEDPDKRVAGSGIALLRAAGINVKVGLAADSITKDLAPYLYHRQTGRTYVLAKAAVSVDGRIAAVDGSSQWISSETARQDVHRIRAESQAILVGAGTAIVDKPSLTVRNNPVKPPHPPIRVVLDARGQLRPPGPLFDSTLAPILIFTTEACPPEIRQLWLENKVEVINAPPGQDLKGIDLNFVLEFLGKKGVLQVMVEGGSSILKSFIEAQLLQQLCLYVGGCILGDRGLPLFREMLIPNISKAPRLKLIEAKAFGDTVRLDYIPDEIKSGTGTHTGTGTKNS